MGSGLMILLWVIMALTSELPSDSPFSWTLLQNPQLIYYSILRSFYLSYRVHLTFMLYESRNSYNME